MKRRPQTGTRPRDTTAAGAADGPRRGAAERRRRRPEDYYRRKIGVSAAVASWARPGSLRRDRPATGAGPPRPHWQCDCGDGIRRSRPTTCPVASLSSRVVGSEALAITVLPVRVVHLVLRTSHDARQDVNHERPIDPHSVARAVPRCNRFAGFEVQTRSRGLWGCSRWRQPAPNTHKTVEDAIAFARQDVRKLGVVVIELGQLPIEVPTP